MFKKRKSSYEDSCGVLREKEKERFKNIKYIIHPDRKLVILRALNFLIIKISSTHSKKILKLHEPISIYHLLSRILHLENPSRFFELFPIERSITRLKLHWSKLSFEGTAFPMSNCPRSDEELSHEHTSLENLWTPDVKVVRLLVNKRGRAGGDSARTMTNKLRAVRRRFNPFILPL